MTEFIQYLLLTSAWIWGVNCLFSEDHIFEKAGDWVFDNMPEWVYKPTIGCAACMSSIHGTIAYFILFDRNAVYLRSVYVLQWWAFCICLCGLNFLLIKFTSKERIIKDED